MHCTPTLRQSNNKLWFEDKMFPWIKNMRWLLANQTTSTTWESPCLPDRLVYLCKTTSCVYPTRETSLWNTIPSVINSHYTQKELTFERMSEAEAGLWDVTLDYTSLYGDHSSHYHLQVSWQHSLRNVWRPLSFYNTLIIFNTQCHRELKKVKITVAFVAMDHGEFYRKSHRISGVRSAPQGSLSPTLGLTQDHPKFKPYVWEQCPNIPWTLAVWGRAHRPVVQPLSPTPSCPFPDTAPCRSLGPCRCHTEQSSALPLRSLWGAAAAIRPPLSSSALGTTRQAASDTQEVPIHIYPSTLFLTRPSWFPLSGKVDSIKCIFF